LQLSPPPCLGFPFGMIPYSFQTFPFPPPLWLFFSLTHYHFFVHFHFLFRSPLVLNFPQTTNETFLSVLFHASTPVSPCPYSSSLSSDFIASFAFHPNIHSSSVRDSCQSPPQRFLRRTPPRVIVFFLFFIQSRFPPLSQAPPSLDFFTFGRVHSSACPVRFLFFWSRLSSSCLLLPKLAPFLV